MALASKLAKASLIVGGSLLKDKTNMQDRYSYVSADSILSAAGQALAEVGVTIFPSVTHTDIVVFDRGGGKNRYDAKVDFVFIIADDESQMELVWPGYGSDYTVPDKAVYKAITSGHKYFLAKLLNIGAGNEDGEHEGGGNSTSLAGRVNESDKTCKLCGAPSGKMHTQKCTATEAPTPATTPSTAAKPAAKAAEPASTIASLDDVEGMEFDTATDEFTAINGPATGQTASAHIAQQTGKLDPAILRKLQAQFTATFNGLPNGLKVDDARHWYIEKWTTKHTSDNVRTSASDVTAEEAETMIAELKKYTPGLRKTFEAFAVEASDIPA